MNENDLIEQIKATRDYRTILSLLEQLYAPMLKDKKGDLNFMAMFDGKKYEAKSLSNLALILLFR